MKSLISLSMHKAGSSIADKIITEFCREKGYLIDRISKQVPDSPLPEKDIYLKHQKVMKLKQVYYGIARGPYVRDMHIINDLRTIIQIRDPRDCLTSAYFSFKQSHVPPRNPKKLEEFQAKRDAISRVTLDEYAVTRAKSYAHRMSILHEILESHNDILLLKYEDMVDRTDFWLHQISEFIDQPRTRSLNERIAGMIKFDVEEENPMSHKRQVRPGDHKRKLTQGTIVTINSILKQPLEWFGY